MARMNGFKTRLFTDLVVDHLKPRNISQGGVIRRKWQMGTRDFALGYHPLFEAVKCTGRILQSPAVIGALAWFGGYCAASLKRRSGIVPAAVVDYVRQEQRQRLTSLLKPFTRKSREAPIIPQA